MRKSIPGFAPAQLHRVIACTHDSTQPFTSGRVLGPNNIGGVTHTRPGVVFHDGVRDLPKPASATADGWN
ncbi:MAG: hypothetical protein QM736_19715 [Vicinamibacterales bacterium]